MGLLGLLGLYCAATALEYLSGNLHRKLPVEFYLKSMDTFGCTNLPDSKHAMKYVVNGNRSIIAMEVLER